MDFILMLDNFLVVSAYKSGKMDQQALQQSFLKLVEVVSELREKCPWDREQTIESIRHLTIEETYELTDAIIRKDFLDMKEELGDVLLHVLFYSQITSEGNIFNIHEVIDTLTEKLIRRHPHVYGDLQEADQERVKLKWEEIKAQEKAERVQQGGKVKESALDGVPDQLPALIKAQRMQEKAASRGFDWNDPAGARAKFMEELAEFDEAETEEEKEKEMGDLLFSLINYCRLSGINADDALSYTNKKFKNRFQYMEGVIQEEGKKMKSYSLEALEALWQEAKGLEK
ncbi:MAG: nucleoside triphosphate pyrophosphohydrolase [Bacteroidota bacterium]